MRSIISLECTGCKRKNYSTTRNKKTNQTKLEIKKYCRACRAHTAHKESK